MQGRGGAIVLVAGLVLVLVLGALMLPRTKGVDAVLTGGRMWTGPGSPILGEGAPTALAVDGGRIVALGADAEIGRLAGWNTRRIDLAGRRGISAVSSIKDWRTSSTSTSRRC